MPSDSLLVDVTGAVRRHLVDRHLGAVAVRRPQPDDLEIGEEHFRRSSTVGTETAQPVAADLRCPTSRLTWLWVASLRSDDVVGPKAKPQNAIG
jgi:hypothetical protein